MRPRRVTISDRRLRALEIMTDARLDHLAERYNELRIGPLTRATFEQYVGNPGYYETIAQVLRSGGSLQWFEFAGTMIVRPAA